MISLRYGESYVIIFTKIFGLSGTRRGNPNMQELLLKSG